VIALIAEGLTNREIAHVLVLSKETVKSHVKNVLARTGCRSRSEVVNVAWKRGYLPVDEAWVDAQLSRLSTLTYESGQRR
jgi:predicted DNA-binding transcriptional regulator